MKLLFAEDDRDLSTAVRTLLERNGYMVDTVYDGAEAVDYALEGEYDGMILEAYEVAEWLHAKSTFMERVDARDEDRLSDRYEFVGRIADDSVRNRYVEKSAASFSQYANMFQPSTVPDMPRYAASSAFRNLPTNGS